MSYNTITAKQVIDAVSANGPAFLVPDIKLGNKRNSNDEAKATWTQCKFKDANGDSHNPRFEVRLMPTNSAAKLPFKPAIRLTDTSSDKDWEIAIGKNNLKYMVLGFQHISSPDEIKEFFPPKDPDSKASVERSNSKIESLIKMNNENVQMFMHIREAYRLLALRLVELEESGEITYQIHMNQKQAFVINEFGIGKVLVKGSKKKTIEIEHPYFKTRIPLVYEDGKMGICYNKKGTAPTMDNFKDILYDLGKRDPKTGTVPPARRKIKNARGKNVYVPHTYKTVGDCINYRSIVGGTLCCDTVIASMQGASLSARWEKLNFLTNKVKRVIGGLSEEAAADVNDVIDIEDSDSDQAAESGEDSDGKKTQVNDESDSEIEGSCDELDPNEIETLDRDGSNSDGAVEEDGLN
jgi:hypothetical protein